MKDENRSWSWLRHSMSNLSYREACNFNKARGNNPQGLAKRKRDVHSLPCSQCGLLLPSSLKLWSLAEKWRGLRDQHSAPAQHTVNGIQEHFTTHQTPTGLPPGFHKSHVWAPAHTVRPVAAVLLKWRPQRKQASQVWWDYNQLPQTGGLL